MNEYSYPQTKQCYLFDEVTGMYTGMGVGYLEPPFDQERYYAPPNSIYTAPRGQVGLGRGYRINDKRNGWLVVEDWSNVPLWDTATSLPLPSPAPGKKLPQGATYVEPPECAENEWPRWDAQAEAWSIGRNHKGLSWFDGLGNEGALSLPWEELPEGAQFGLSPMRKRANMRVAQKRLLSDANDLIELCQEMLEMPEATTGDAELLKQAKAFKREVMQINLDADPDTFVEPEFPHVRFRQGELLGE